MELRQLKSFLAIAQTGSFTTAAERLCLTQSTLSHQINLLEEALGTKLFVRTRPHVLVTEAGESLLPSVERILSEMDDIRTRFGLDVEHGDPVIRVASTALGFAYIYGDLCHAFIEHHPEVKLDFSATETPEAAISKILARTADVAFVPLSGESPSLDTVALAEVEHVFIVGSSHPLAGQREVDLNDLQENAFIRYHRGTGSRAMSDQAFGSSGYPRILTESNDTDFVKRIVSIGLGVALVPIFAVVNELKSRQLHALRLRSHRLSDRCGLATNTRRPLRLLKSFEAVCMSCRGESIRKFTLETLDSISLYRPAAS